MFGFFAGIGGKIIGGVSIALALTLLWGFRVDHLRANWKGKYETLHGEAQTVLIALRTTTNNPKLEWKNAPGQIVALGEEVKSLKSEINDTNEKLDDMARRFVEAKAKAVELRRIADRAQAQRQAALAKLSDMAITPGTRQDCMTLLQEAESALDLVREAGI